MPLPPLQFFHRWLSHICAPTFLFLAGTALALSIERKVARGDGAGSIDRDMFVRGLIILGGGPVLHQLVLVPRGDPSAGDVRDRRRDDLDDPAAPPAEPDPDHRGHRDAVRRRALRCPRSCFVPGRRRLDAEGAHFGARVLRHRPRDTSGPGARSAFPDAFAVGYPVLPVAGDDGVRLGVRPLAARPQGRGRRRLPGGAPAAPDRRRVCSRCSSSCGASTRSATSSCTGSTARWSSGCT